MKRVAAGAHLPRPWLFEPAKRPGSGCGELKVFLQPSGSVRLYRPDDRADYCLRFSFLPLCEHRDRTLQPGSRYSGHLLREIDK